MISERKIAILDKLLFEYCRRSIYHDKASGYTF